MFQHVFEVIRGEHLPMDKAPEVAREAEVGREASVFESFFRPGVP